MSSILQNLDQPALEQAMNANHAAFWMALAEHASDIAEHHGDSKIAWMSSSTDYSYPFNLVQPLMLQADEQGAAVTASIERAKKRNVHTEWWLSPGHLAAGLREHLQAQGYVHMGGPAGMAVDFAKLNEDIPRPSDFEIITVKDEASLNVWVDAFVGGWPGPDAWRPFFTQAYGGYGFEGDLRHYIGMVGGKPVTASSVMLAAGVAGIYTVATHADYRGRGLGAWITLQPLLDARENGYKVGILQASKMGQPVYERLGFAERFRYRVFQWPP